MYSADAIIMFWFSMITQIIRVIMPVFNRIIGVRIIDDLLEHLSPIDLLDVVEVTLSILPLVPRMEPGLLLVGRHNLNVLSGEESRAILLYLPR